jgi:uncharacterized phosphosugar-binding protein
MRVAAKKCVRCGSYQDWRANLGVGGTILSLLVALGSILTVAVPVMISAITPENSTLIFSYQGATKEDVTILVSNRGIRPGSFLSHGNLELVGESGKETIPVQLNEKVRNGGAQIIEAGKSELFDFYTDVINRPELNVPQNGKCRLNLSAQDFKAQRADVTIPIVCSQLNEFVTYMHRSKYYPD